MKLLIALAGPQTFRPKDKPNYRPAEITIVVCWCACLVDLVLIWLFYKRQNAKKAQLRGLPSYTKMENQEFLDLTDRENPEFVYTL